MSHTRQTLLRVFGPIDSTDPTQKDIILTDKLMDAIKEMGQFESNEEIELKGTVLDKIEDLLNDFIDTICSEKGIPIVSPEGRNRGEIHTFGLHGLGLCPKGAHTDVLCVAPKIIERKDFFQTFYPILKAQEGVTESRAVEDAYVPVIKLKFDGVDMHIVFARLALQMIPEDFDIRNDNMLKGLDEHSFRSIRWFRAMKETLHLVPNMDNFRNTLGAILSWARCRRVHGDIWGYLSEISWAILVAKTCLLYPRAVASTLIHKLFSLFSHWKWPEPVLLKQWKSEHNQLSSADGWDDSDDRQVMPIIGPAYPHPNFAFRATQSSRHTMKQEFIRGNNIVSDIYEDKATWVKLFEEPQFFKQYEHFVMVTLTAEGDKQYKKWIGLTESKLRLLVTKLEWKHEVDGADIYPKAFSSTNNGKRVSRWFLGLRMNSTRRINLISSIQIFTSAARRQARQWGFCDYDTRLEAVHVTRNETLKNLPEEFVTEFGLNGKTEMTAGSSAGDKSAATSNVIKATLTLEGDQETKVFCDTENAHVSSSHQQCDTAFNLSSSQQNPILMRPAKRSLTDVTASSSPVTKSGKLDE